MSAHFPLYQCWEDELKALQLGEGSSSPSRLSLASWASPCLPAPSLPNISTLCRAGMKVSRVRAGWHVELPNIQARGRAQAPRSAASLAAELSFSAHSCYSISGATSCCFLAVSSSERSCALHTRLAALAAHGDTAARRIITVLQWARDYGDSS